MKILVIGANGQIGRLFCQYAAEAGVPVCAMIRSPEQQSFFEALGVETVIADLEGDFRHAIYGCDQVLFAAGSGPHTGLDKTLMIDLHGAIRAIDLAREIGVTRFMMISTLHTDPLEGPEKLRPYLAAKHAADTHLIASTLPYVILRPGRLTDESASGRIATSRDTASSDAISRADVAKAALSVIQRRDIKDRELVLLDGNEPLNDALC
ncbi:SDR family oxidoreductase [Phytohalomonas tamaricis]|uniref:SDR family oxidoreductase n=1 Tax=Phytohalomonas tamaricis TaxID=2081032 RepID=UPI000D0B18C8|nr:SDR family oxidoreductase [Phytohalomonas tamaricis]